MEKQTAYFLKVSGSVLVGKQREFQLTVQFIFNQLPSTCLRRNLALDLDTSNLYHVFTLWKSEDALHAFRASHEFDLLKGTFQTLGFHQETMTGKWADIELFELDRQSINTQQQ